MEQRAKKALVAEFRARHLVGLWNVSISRPEGLKRLREAGWFPSERVPDQFVHDMPDVAARFGPAGLVIAERLAKRPSRAVAELVKCTVGCLAAGVFLPLSVHTPIVLEGARPPDERVVRRRVGPPEGDEPCFWSLEGSRVIVEFTESYCEHHRHYFEAHFGGEKWNRDGTLRRREFLGDFPRVNTPRDAQALVESTLRQLVTAAMNVRGVRLAPEVKTTNHTLVGRAYRLVHSGRLTFEIELPTAEGPVSWGTMPVDWPVESAA